MEFKRDWELWVSATIIALTVLLMIAYYNRWFSFSATIGPFRIIHYVAFAGTLYIAFGVILFAALRRRSPTKFNVLLKTHALGNLVAFMLISLHFAGQVGRPADFYPDFGTGIALYVALVVLVGTGLALRFNLLRNLSYATKHFFHTGLAIAFYLIIIVHILHGLNVI